MTYNQNNIFAKILRGDIPCEAVYENDHVLAFDDLYPKAPTHVLVIPKGAYTDMDDFTSNATSTEITALFTAVGDIARLRGIEKTGYRIISNCGTDGRQEVPHLHIHILGGAKMVAIVGAE